MSQAQSRDSQAAKPQVDPVDAIIDQWRQVRPDLHLSPMAIFGWIHRTSELSRRRLRTLFAQFGIALSEFDVIATLRRSGAPFELSPKDLSGTLMLTSGGLTGRLDKLERAGLVERLPDPNDRRGLRIRLTSEGKRVADQAVGAEIIELSTALDIALTETEQEALAELLRKLHTFYAGESLD